MEDIYKTARDQLIFQRYQLRNYIVLAYSDRHNQLCDPTIDMETRVEYIGQMKAYKDLFCRIQGITNNFEAHAEILRWLPEAQLSQKPNH